VAAFFLRRCVAIPIANGLRPAACGLRTISTDYAGRWPFVLRVLKRDEGWGALQPSLRSAERAGYDPADAERRAE